MATWVLYGSRLCEGCLEAKAILRAKKIPFMFLDIQKDKIARATLQSRKIDIVPAVWTGKEFIVGVDLLKKYLRIQGM